MKKAITTTVALVFGLVVYHYGRYSAVREILSRNEIEKNNKKGDE